MNINLTSRSSSNPRSLRGARMNPRTIALTVSLIVATVYAFWYYLLIAPEEKSNHTTKFQTKQQHKHDNSSNSSSSTSKKNKKNKKTKKTPNNETPSEDPSSPLVPQRMVVGDTEVFYMVPARKTKAVGILIFFHGCNHGGQDFFMLPEDRTVAREALRLGLAVLSVTSHGRKSGCWSPSHDLPRVSHVVETVLREAPDIPPSSLPRMGMGASSGASFLFRAYEPLKLSSMASYIMWKSFSADDLNDPTKSLPATAFIYMPRDPKSVTAVPEHSKVLSQQQRNVATRVWQVHPHALTPAACAQRIPELECRAILEYAKEKHPEVLDADYNVLLPYKSGKWDPIFQHFSTDEPYLALPSQPSRGTKSFDFSHHSWKWAALVEEIAVSYAQHEMTAEHHQEVLSFLMVNAGISDDSV